MLNTFKARLREPSSWAGFAAMIAAAAQAWQTKDPAAISAVVGGVLAIALPEKGAQ